MPHVLEIGKRKRVAVIMVNGLRSKCLQARIVGVNAQYFLKNSGFFVISIKASCIDSTAPPEAVFAREVKKLQEQQLKPREQVRT